MILKVSETNNIEVIDSNDNQFSKCLNNIIPQLIFTNNQEVIYHRNNQTLCVYYNLFNSVLLYYSTQAVDMSLSSSVLTYMQRTS